MVDIIPFRQCTSNSFWQKEVEGSNNRRYIVSFNKQYDDNCEYDYECTCPAFQWRSGYCKHILAVKDERCGWHEQYEYGEIVDNKCPRCGEQLEVVMCGV